ncbi:hypothetical protein EDB92DRAFT_1934423 [Lactarius akahatsu]|uniref:Uncharacterized protein n=1 Tax=Lactarius akahatsu TaxID=416441 RepID=A0AAD4LKG7_9AGAM|nr:hypothetical protein EDB92DRAFT_1934423 [Lactarius akahatsu]
MHFISPTLFFLLFLPVSVLSVANSTDTNTDTCNPSHNGLATGTLQYNSDCNATTWCDNGVCRNKGCRRDEFPLGYITGDSRGSGKRIDLPQKCSVDEFCPDEGSQCAPKIQVGQPCQFDRDDSCIGPDDFKDLRDTTGRGLNVNGSICLNFVCQFANVTAGSTCEIENTGYIAYGPSGEFVYVVSRDNCKVGLYCDTNSTIWVRVVHADKECSSYNCLPDQTCGEIPSNPHHLPMWVYIIIGIGIFGGMIATLVVLFIFHGRQREDEREKRLQYWREQNAFRQNILQMHETARNSIFTTPGSVSRRSALFGYYDRGRQCPNSSGLRHYVGEDSGSYEGGSDNEQLVMRTPYAHDNKI